MTTQTTSARPTSPPNGAPRLRRILLAVTAAAGPLALLAAYAAGWITDEESLRLAAEVVLAVQAGILGTVMAAFGDQRQAARTDWTVLGATLVGNVVVAAVAEEGDVAAIGWWLARAVVLGALGFGLGDLIRRWRP